MIYICRAFFFPFHVDSLLVTNWLYVTRRQVDAKDGEKLAKTNDCAWIETSAKNNVNVGAYFVPHTTYFPASLGLLNGLSPHRQGFRTLLARNRKDDGSQSS